MKVPNAEQATVATEKITHYLLNPAHWVGGPKSAFFLAFGFTIADWETMAAALRLHVRTHDVASIRWGADTTGYSVVGSLTTPDGRDPVVRSAWYIKDGDTIPQFSSAYPP